MKSKILSARIVKQRELDGLSSLEVRAFKRTISDTRCVRGILQTTKTTLYYAHFNESGEIRCYPTYAELKKVVQ